MALIRVAQYSSTPTVVGDYQAQNAHLQAFTNQINSQAFILSDPYGFSEPLIKQGAYISHGGSLYIVDTADETISGSPSDGTVYIRVSGTDTLAAEYITNISSYAWSSAYNALISGPYTLLPYILIKSGTSYTKYRFDQHKQVFGNAIISGHDIHSELDTLNGRVNQAVNTTSSPTFASIGVTGAISGASVDTGQGATEVHLMNQNLRTTDNVSFANLNPPVDNDDNVMPNIGIGGFTLGHVNNGNITLPPFGTIMLIAFADNTFSETRSGRKSGGTVISYSSINGNVFAWRIS